jgi:predicted nucleotidyltransferase
MKANANLEPVLERLRALLPELRERYAVDTLEIFGSRVREDAREESDLDILVTFTVTPGFFEFIRLENELADRLRIPVDLVMRRSLKPQLRERILAEAIPV